MSGSTRLREGKRTSLSLGLRVNPEYSEVETDAL